MDIKSIIKNRDLIERTLCEKSLYAFLKYGWPSIDAAEFSDGWHLKVICQELEKIAKGEEGYRDYVFNIPPRHCKSLAISVAFPAWIWTWWPECKFITASYAIALSLDSSVKMRRLIESPWYQKHWGGKVRLIKDQNQKQYFENTAGGHRFTTSSGGVITGKGCDIVISDDPNNLADISSEKTSESIIEWWRGAVPTRLNNQKTGRKIVIQQRVNEKDVTSWCLKNGYKHLVLPAEFEVDHPYRSPLDRRTTDGELLWPERFGRKEIDYLKRSLGSYHAAGQLQQRPAPREGGMFKRHWFDVVSAAPAKAQRVRHWDMAATAEAQGAADPDWTVGVKIAKDQDGIYYVEDVRRMRETSLGVEKAIKSTAAQDGASVVISIPQDPGAAGKAMASYLVRQLAGFTVKAEPETGDKATRASPFAAQCEAGNVKLIKADWNDAFLDELTSFPNAAHDDQVDAASGAFKRLVGSNSDALLRFYGMEMEKRKEEQEKKVVNG